MRTFKKPKIGISKLFMISSLVLIGSAGSAIAEDEAKPNTGPAFNSLESVQINCAAAHDSQQESDRDLTAKIHNLAASAKPEERISALSQLAGKASIDANVVQKILQAAIRDSDANVRAQAIYAVAKQNCADASLILEQALQASELSVRLMAVDSLAADETGAGLLEQALNDEDEAVRELAALKLASLSR